MPKLSVVIPCYNEEATLESVVRAVHAVGDDSLAVEIVLVDDGSTDGSLSVARRLEEELDTLVVVAHGRNQGKGAALQTGFRRATGDVVTVQDADLEYDPAELRGLAAPILAGEADVVYGSRFLGTGERPPSGFLHRLGNRLLTALSNACTGLRLTDMETCYKVFRRGVIQDLEIQEKRFGVEPEITAKLARKGLSIVEKAISYAPRSYGEGKKIGPRDALRALYCIVRYSRFSSSP